ncbi:L10-interacting MYB domain-containing protein-like [Trifolium pratense]|uniref:Uncharacterized protein n=1 Tax=Trifolium pratense TaxID=57577 RepID=A0ACB0JT41_TRIPR|nr:L10-interacting MYB domain-containing protein-like [Trifolium pratense]CAJ2646623.1 unnamed protein product [Trifolium pratense]
MAGHITRSRRLATLQLEQSRAKWTASLTKTLADLMVDQVHKGNKQNNSFNKKAWKYICDGFYNKTGLKWDKEQLKNRHSVLRRQYATVKSILDQGDFIWDEVTGFIRADDEIWEEYIKNHPDAETVKSGGCPIFNELCTIFAEPATNGKHEYLAASDGEHTPTAPCPEFLSTHQEEESSETEDDEDGNDPQTVQPTATYSSRKRGRKGVDNAIADAILEMASASKMRAAAIEQLNSKYSVADCIKYLDLMQDVDQQLYFSALDLFNNPNAREVFLSLKEDKRLTWLHRRCAVVYNR